MSSRTLTDHDAIREWAEARDGRPARVADTREGETGGVIRLAFGGDDDGLEIMEWEEWFSNFDENGLALVVQDETADGETSSFNKLVSRD